MNSVSAINARQCHSRIETKTKTFPGKMHSNS